MDKYKIIIIGPTGSGKSTFLSQLKRGEELECSNIKDYHPTIGVDLHCQKIEHNSRIIKIHMWDTAGQERFDSIINSYYRDADMVMLFYDINESDNDKQISKWCTKIIDYADNKPTILLGNKIDVKKIFFSENNNLINNCNIIKHFQISNFDLDNVKYVMDYIYNYIINNINYSKKSETVSLKKKTVKTKCCY